MVVTRESRLLLLLLVLLLLQVCISSCPGRVYVLLTHVWSWYQLVEGRWALR